MIVGAEFRFLVTVQEDITGKPDDYEPATLRIVEVDIDESGLWAYVELPDDTEVRARERARIVWWLRAGVAGPAAVNEDPAVLATITEMADVIEQHPERFADAPTGRPT